MESRGRSIVLSYAALGGLAVAIVLAGQPLLARGAHPATGQSNRSHAEGGGVARATLIRPA